MDLFYLHSRSHSQLCVSATARVTAKNGRDPRARTVILIAPAGSIVAALARAHNRVFAACGRPVSRVGNSLTRSPANLLPSLYQDDGRESQIDDNEHRN